MKKKTYEGLLVCKQPRMEQTIETKIKLTDKERLELLDELTEADQQLSAAKDGEKAAKSEWKAKIDEIETEQADLMKTARSGFETRSVPCLVVLHPKGKVKYYYDAETLERVETVSMTQADYQTQLDFEREAATEEGGAE